MVREFRHVTVSDEFLYLLATVGKSGNTEFVIKFNAGALWRWRG